MNLRTVILTAVLSAPALDAQVRWQPIQDVGNLSGAAMATDYHRNQIVRFGGGRRGVPLPTTIMPFLDDTWIWDGKEWQHVEPDVSPPARAAHVMAYDPQRKSIILFGGYDGKALLNDTWEWDGRTWRQLRPAKSPPPIFSASMAPDLTRGRVALFGGYTYNSYYALDETWIWDGTNWALAQPATRPRIRAAAAMTWDPHRQAIALYGGQASGGNYCLDRAPWYWDGTNWSPDPEPAGRHPEFRWSAVLLPGSRPGTLLMHGGHNGPTQRYINDTWLWDGTRWTELSGSPRPPARYSQVAAVDPVRGGGIWTGGGDWFDVGVNRPTWRLRDQTWSLAEERAWPRGDFEAVYDPDRDAYLFIGTDVRPKPTQTWLLQEDQFTKVATTNPPQSRPYSAVVYYPPMRSVFLYGGQNPFPPHHDTWTLTNGSWTQHHQAGSPKVDTPVCAYHPQRKTIVMPDFAKNELWEWDRNGWRVVSRGNVPRLWGYVTYSEALGLLIVHGYDRATRTPSTWSWDGRVWQQYSPRNMPPPYYRAGLVDAPAFGGVVLAGGRSERNAMRDDTWVFDGVDWRILEQGGLPDHPNHGHVTEFTSLAYNHKRQQLLAVYGLSDNRPQTYSIWQMSPHTLSTPTSGLRPGSPLQLNVRSPDHPRDFFLLGFSSGTRPGIPLPVGSQGSLLLPLAPSPMLNASFQIGIGGALDRTGKLAISIPTPNNPYFIGLPLHVAGVTLATRQITSITNSLQVRFVR